MKALSEIVKDQIGSFMDAKDLDIKTLAAKIGVTESKLRNEMNTVGEVGYTVLESLLEKYPELSTEWLFRGEGEMFKLKQEEKSNRTELECLQVMSKHLENISKSLSVIANKRNRN